MKQRYTCRPICNIMMDFHLPCRSRTPFTGKYGSFCWQMSSLLRDLVWKDEAVDFGPLTHQQRSSHFVALVGDSHAGSLQALPVKPEFGVVGGFEECCGAAKSKFRKTIPRRKIPAPPRMVTWPYCVCRYVVCLVRGQTKSPFCKDSATQDSVRMLAFRDAYAAQ